MIETPEDRQRYWLHTGVRSRYFRRHRILRDRHDRWRSTAQLLKLSRAARGRLEWMIYCEQNHGDVSLTARHFGIARKTYYKWLARFDDRFLRGLEEESRAPRHRRQKQYTARQYERVVRLRRSRIRYGKMKLLEIYRNRYPEDAEISNWKIQCIITACGLYYHPQKQARINRKRSQARRRITELPRQSMAGFLICLDTIVRYWQGEKRFILTAIDRHTKVAFARMYTTHSSVSARDFLHRLHYLLDGKITNIQTDNGSEFHRHFDAACEELGLEHYWSRRKTPKDNAVNERFNRTLQEEFIELGNMRVDPNVFNRLLTEWLVEYNFRRPHQALRYMPPMNFTFKYHNVLPMYPSSTGAGRIRQHWYPTQYDRSRCNTLRATGKCLP